MNIGLNLFRNGTVDSSHVELSNVPDTCPICNRAASLIIHAAYGTAEHRGKEEGIQVVLQCPRTECRRLSIGYFIPTREDFRTADFRYILPKRMVTTEFSEEIRSVSQEFTEIYVQAQQAETEGLDKIAGVGYRKALEFLIKDYAIKLDPSSKVEIEKKNLSKVISENVDDRRIKDVSERAAWLGNDETHYVRKWSDKDINDLKMLIQLTVHWIDSEALTMKLVADMPKGGPPAEDGSDEEGSEDSKAS